MKSQRKSQFILALLAALALVSFGCKKEQGEGKEGEAKTAEGEKKAEGGEGAAKAAAPSKTSFAVFPKESEFVFGLNGDSLRKSGIYKKFQPAFEGALNNEKEFVAFKETCGFDPIQKVQSVIVGGSMEGNDGVVVVKGFNRAELKSCGEKMAAKEGEDVKIEEDGKLMKVTNKSDVMWLGWLDDNTMLTGAGSEGEGGKAWVEGRMAGKDGLDSNADMMSLLGQVDSAGTLWFIVKPKDNSKMGMMGAPPSSVFGTVLLTSGLKIDMGMRYAKPEDAKAFVDQTKQMMGAMASDPTSKMVADKTTMEAKGNDAIIKVDLNEEELNQVIAMVEKMAGPMIGSMLGGGM